MELRSVDVTRVTAPLTAVIPLAFLLSCREAEDRTSNEKTGASAVSRNQAPEQEALVSIEPGAEQARVMSAMTRGGAKNISEFIGYRSARLFKLSEWPPEKKDVPEFEDQFYQLEGRIYWLVFQVQDSVGILETIRVADSAEKLERKQESWTTLNEIPLVISGFSQNAPASKN